MSSTLAIILAAGGIGAVVLAFLFSGSTATGDGLSEHGSEDRPDGSHTDSSSDSAGDSGGDSGGGDGGGGGD